ncbi:MAG: hypothetical protein HKP20_03465, partial [Akkermansiaceae bacterium]|nr:hypothetical protein [Akkermansiaceae bacterium]
MSIEVWDAENRLVAITRADNTTIWYGYDYLSRRISKQLNSDPATLFIYKGWNLCAEYTGTTLKKTYTWGMDLSGSMQGAGGVGGLLRVTEHSEGSGGSGGSTSHYYPAYNGNGDVSEYLDTSGNVVTHYQYDPFGNTTVANGSKKDDFAHRFSTKYLDEETGLYYYGYRYYDPVTGRWPSRDPLGESWDTDEFNEYCFINNYSYWDYDILGLKGGKGGKGGGKLSDEAKGRLSG